MSYQPLIVELMMAYVAGLLTLPLVIIGVALIVDDTPDGDVVPYD